MSLAPTVPLPAPAHTGTPGHMRLSTLLGEDAAAPPWSSAATCCRAAPLAPIHCAFQVHTPFQYDFEAGGTMAPSLTSPERVRDQPPRQHSPSTAT